MCEYIQLFYMLNFFINIFINIFYKYLKLYLKNNIYKKKNNIYLE